MVTLALFSFLVTSKSPSRSLLSLYLCAGRHGFVLLLRQQPVTSRRPEHCGGSVWSPNPFIFNEYPVKANGTEPTSNCKFPLYQGPQLFRNDRPAYLASNILLKCSHFPWPLCMAVSPFTHALSQVNLLRRLDGPVTSTLSRAQEKVEFYLSFSCS